MVMKKQIIFLVLVYCSTISLIFCLDLIQKYSLREIRYNFLNVFYTLSIDDFFSLLIGFTLLIAYVWIMKKK